MNARRADVLAVIVFFLASGLMVATARTQPSTTAHAPAPGQVPNPAGKKAEEQFKNIQVLKGIPAEELFPTMQFIAASLGVQCDFCHVQGAFEKDDKKTKQTARKMMEMMFAINKDNFDGHRAVTCNSCHHGDAMPQPIPAVMTEEPKEPMGAREGGRIERERRTITRPVARQICAGGRRSGGHRQGQHSRPERHDRFWREIAADRHLFEGSGRAHIIHPHAGGR